MKKIVTLAVCPLMTLSLLVTGCAVSTSEPGTASSTTASSSGAAESSGSSSDKSTVSADSSASATGENKTLDVFYWDDINTSTDLATQQFKVAVDKFNEEDNGYTANVITTDISNYYTKLNALVAADDLPDVFMCHPGTLMRNAAKAGVLLPLDDYLKEDGWYDTFVTPYFDNLKYDGKIVSMPMKAAAACVFYNKDMFETAGIDTLPKTWDEFLSDCQTLKDAGYTPIASSGTEDWVIGILGGYLCDRTGGRLDSILNGEKEWTDQSFIDAGNCLLQLVDNGYFQDSFLGDSNDQMTYKFIHGQAAMMITGSWGISSINGDDSEVAEVAGVFPFPSISGDESDSGRYIIKTDNICIDHDTEDLDASLDFLKILSSQEIQKNFAEIAGATPIISDANVNYDKAPAQLKELNDCLANMTGSFGYFNESLPGDTGGAFNNAILTIALKQETPEEAFQVVQEQWEKDKNK